MPENATKPLGKRLSYCSHCGGTVQAQIPFDDNRPRYVCSHCSMVHYENPKPVVGCVAEWEGQILLCKRAIQPRYGYWTLPAGFMELGESIAAAAIRETREEAQAEVRIGRMLASIDVIRAGQVHIFFCATLVAPAFSAGTESLDVRLFAPNEIPWGELAFTSNRIALEQYLHQRETGRSYVWSGNAL